MKKASSSWNTGKVLLFLSIFLPPFILVSPAQNPYGQFKYGPPKDENFFPICVWLQNPNHAEEYKRIGFNIYVGLWRGPTEEQLIALKKTGMYLICKQNEIGLKHIDDSTIIGWMHDDEPDNAQRLPQGNGYAPPIAPEKIIEDYKQLRQRDPSRPVLLNLGQGVAWDNWVGRGVRKNHPEDYSEYVKGCDIVSFDIYPATHSSPEVAGKLWFIAGGVQRLTNWTKNEKIVWNCIECTQISNPMRKPTPHEVRCEVWMSLIHGSRGLIYFVHQWQPKFIEAGLLADKEMTGAVSNINHQIHELAPVINSPSVTQIVELEYKPEDATVSFMAKRKDGFIYIFAVSMRNAESHATFRIKKLKNSEAEVFKENRKIIVKNGEFSDNFNSWDVHIYKIKEQPDQ
ncbi:MAG: hypothetical protein N2487_02230 [Verrucomicrobiae bacterium]|nr:hypothetical protein [Verrucomicrobiae bacterium]